MLVRLRDPAIHRIHCIVCPVAEKELHYVWRLRQGDIVIGQGEHDFSLLGRGHKRGEQRCVSRHGLPIRWTRRAIRLDSVSFAVRPQQCRWTAMHRRNGDVPANTLPGSVNPRRNWPGWDTHLLARDSQLPFSSVFVLENMFVLFCFIAACW